MNAFDQAASGETARQLFSLTDRLYRANSLDEAFAAALDSISGLLGCDRASILMFDTDGVMRFRAWRGLSDGYRQAVDGHTPWKPGDLDPAPIFIADFAQSDEPQWLKDTIAGEGICALGFVPLTIQRWVVGKFMTYHGAPHAFDVNEQQAAVAIARQLSFFIERSRVDELRQQGEVALRDSELKFRRMTEDAPIMLWLSGPTGKCAYLNTQMRDFWGVAPDQVTNFDWGTTIHPDDAQRVGETMTQAALERRSVRLKARYRRHADGSFRTLETVATPNIAADGSFLGMIGVNADVTERDEAEAALSRSEQRFRELADTMPQLVWVADPTGTVAYWNSRIEEYTPDCRGADGQLHWAKLIHPDDLAPTSAAWQAAVAGLTAYEFSHRLRMVDGNYRWHLSRATPVFDVTGTMVQWYGTATDVHELVSYEERLKESEQQQRLAVDAAGLGVFKWDLTTDTATWLNTRMYEMFGHGPDQPPLSWAAFAEGALHPEDRSRVEQALTAALTSGDLPSLKLRMYRPGETVARWLEVAGTVERNGANEPVGLVGVVGDITDRQRSEEYKNLLIDELNHRVKNTLAVVQSLASQTYREGVPFGPATATFRGRLSALAQAHNLLAQESWEKASLADVAQSILANGRDARIVAEGSLVQLRPKQAVSLALALHELYTNAVKYGALRDDAGRVKLSWTLLPLGAQRMLTIRWSESCATPIAAPGKSGFGSVMIRQALKSELGADVEMTFLPSGLDCTISANLAGVN